MTASSSRVTFSVAGLLKVLLSTGTIALLLLSWGLLFRFIVLETDLLLPYDTSWYEYWGWPQDSPPPGSWQRGLNYFFESPVGSVLPAILAVGMDALLLGIVLFRISQFREQPLPLLLSFAITNLVSVPVMFWAGYTVTASLAGELTGWSGTMVAWLPSWLLLILLFTVQGWVLPKKLVSKGYA
ncbi:MAG: hypothetical protein GXP38_01665 [Chloroflexi bacterium]|nr:hypothetical protein [Chloroflexota bacterium]